MQQFNLDTWLKDKSRKVITRDGRPVRIVCWDRPGFYPIIGYTEDELNLCFSTTKSGFYCKDGAHSQNDLFFADEKEELTEFEKDLQTIISEASHWTSNDGSISTYCQFGDKEIKKISAQIIDLARKEVLKDLPKWKKVDSNPAKFQYNLQGKRLYKDGEYYIELIDLETLPKEE